VQKQRELTLDGFVAGQLKKIPSLQDVQITQSGISVFQTAPLLDEVEMNNIVKFKFQNKPSVNTISEISTPQSTNST
jgi:hypothetical protein